MIDVSVIIPAYNAESYICETLASIFSQTHRNIEVILINDCSTDATLEVIQSKFTTENRLEIVNLQSQSGVASARNVGIKESKGEFIAFCDSDDVWQVDKLKQQLEIFYDVSSKGLKKIIIGSNVIEIDANGNFLGTRETISITSRSEILTRNYITLSSVLCLKRDIEKFLFRNVRHEDYDLWIRMLEAGFRFYYHPNQLTKYRRHSTSLTSNKLKSLWWHVVVQWTNRVSIQEILLHLFLNFKSRILK